jgi:DNA-binding LytR/AlgR family response regulator
MPRRALVADDDPLTRELIASMLEELGCETLTARSATDALGQLARDEGIDILFADVNMPGLSGRELAERARDFRPSARIPAKTYEHGIKERTVVKFDSLAQAIAAHDSLAYQAALADWAMERSATSDRRRHRQLSVVRR